MIKFLTLFGQKLSKYLYRPFPIRFGQFNVTT